LLYNPAEQCIDASQNTAYCDAGLPCKDGWYCPVFDRANVGTSCIERGALNEPCSMDEARACQPGLACNFYKCKPADAPNGSVCDSGEEKFSPEFPRLCAHGSYCAPADNPSTIAEIEGICAPRKATGQDCESSNECAGYCSNGKCAPPALNSPCGSEGECPTGTRCWGANQCVTHLTLGALCTTTGSPCPEDSICYSPSGANPKHCTPVALKTEDCSQAVCATGLVCAASPD
jgi:hypothetical protein